MLNKKIILAINFIQVFTLNATDPDHNRTQFSTLQQPFLTRGRMTRSTTNNKTEPSSVASTEKPPQTSNANLFVPTTTLSLQETTTPPQPKVQITDVLATPAPLQQVTNTLNILPQPLVPNSQENLDLVTVVSPQQVASELLEISSPTSTQESEPEE